MCFIFFFFKQKTAYEMRISDWSSDVCSSDLVDADGLHFHRRAAFMDELRRAEQERFQAQPRTMIRNARLARNLAPVREPAFLFATPGAHDDGEASIRAALYVDADGRSEEAHV